MVSIFRIRMQRAIDGGGIVLAPILNTYDSFLTLSYPDIGFETVMPSM